MKPNFRELFDDILEEVLRNPIPVANHIKATWIVGFISGVAVMLVKQYPEFVNEIDAIQFDVIEDYAMGPQIQPKIFHPNAVQSYSPFEDSLEDHESFS